MMAVTGIIVIVLDVILAVVGGSGAAKSATVADVRVVEARLTEDQAYAVVEKARDTAVERGVALAQGVVVEGTAVDAVTLVTLETEADLVIVGSKGVDSLFGRIFGAVSVQVLRKSKCDVLVVVP